MTGNKLAQAWQRWRGALWLVVLLAFLTMGTRIVKAKLLGLEQVVAMSIVYVVGICSVVIFVFVMIRRTLRASRTVTPHQGVVLGAIEYGIRRLIASFSSRKGELWFEWAMGAIYQNQIIRYLERSARYGHSGAHFELGLIYEENGQGHAGMEMAAREYQVAANSGHGEAAFRLAEILRWGNGAQKDMAGAVKWYIRSAKAGFEPAIQWLAQAYVSGDGVEKDAAKAAYWAAKAEGHTLGTVKRSWALSAWESSGIITKVQRGFRESVEESAASIVHVPWFGLFSKYSFYLVMGTMVLLLIVLLSMFLYVGRIGIPALIGVAGLLAYGMHLRKDMRRSSESKIMDKMADAGDPEACFQKGMCYQRGTYECPRDSVAAANWLKKAADAGHVEAMFQLGELLAYGQVGPNRQAEAQVWLKKAAGQGHQRAMAWVIPGARPDPE